VYGSKGVDGDDADADVVLGEGEGKKKTNQQGEQQAGTEVRKNNNVHGWRKSATGQGKGTTAVRAAMPGAFKSFFFCVCM
jgi:hypothetical protein